MNRDIALIIKRMLIFVLIVIILGKLLSILVNLDGSPETADTITQIPVVKTIQDKNDKIVAIIRAQELERKQYDQVIDSLSRALRLKKKEVVSVDKYIVRTDTVIVGDIRYEKAADSVRFYKKDAYLELLAVGKDTGISYLQLRHTDTLSRTEVRHKPFLRSPYTDVYLRSASPYNTITHGSSFSVGIPRPLITVGPYVGYDPFCRKVSIGISVQFPIITLYKK